ncbi:MAG: DnaJ C-terminal domain-containing protein [Brevundimonas sp.]|uniref:DnaJ C-terminal domain-containing protein n=1 Tax=Brevundimonas sp. TaxID=1871086 RepID=UPI00271E44EE|nr:DnaJ C-terminal domain-containing protein [Brevundimonas sp.]MDO9078283.1 DnaJ C-terminal domain-containing protein [Brevundimonas sp.]MDP3080792.1 DnaJ C-terminal domain-containing protein [Brevundimonas sp.]MDZ4059633.1 DnaJ C-terminal domain-containing protein [Brevundimonas sp.]
MRARSLPEVASTREAYALLGLTGPVDGAALTAAFRIAIKAARPEAAGGSEARFRKTIAAWRLLQHQTAPLALEAPTVRPASPPVVGIGPREALEGGLTEVRIGARLLRVRVPAGLRTGEHLRLKAAGEDGSDLYLPVLVRGAKGLSAVGDDLYMTCPVSHRVLADGGRLEIETHAGPRSAWLVAGHQPLRLRLKGLGLPARGARPQGHLFVTLEPSEDAPSAAEDLLIRFTRVWTPDRLAA